MQRGCIIYWRSVATKLVDPSSVISLINYVTSFELESHLTILLVLFIYMITWFQQKLKFGAKDHMRSQCWVKLVDCILGLKEPLKTISRKSARQNLSSDHDIEKASESNAKLSNQTPGKTELHRNERDPEAVQSAILKAVWDVGLWGQSAILKAI
ncbi:transmembrane protein, putative [Medicago truncatula]|uniref:Transmembrane protein, putative n=1 Tax=Medicago truncatula TaxID=3880 RepID=A0A072TKB9_MEDTR|nr:transmembrane protein, putative [Medicago truncatula]